MMKVSVFLKAIHAFKVDKIYIFTLLTLFFGMVTSARGVHPDKNPRTDNLFFNGIDLKGWSASDMNYWSVEDSAIIGFADKPIQNNQFLWSHVKVRDFYLCVDVLLESNDRNAGIQFRSERKDESGQAIGYQADVGGGVWGRLYHEHGRGKLDWTDRGEKAIKPEQWNRYEILAVGHSIWTAINGTLSVALKDTAGELEGKIAFQIHSGAPQKVKYRVVELVHNPKLRLTGYNKKQLRKQLKDISL